MKLHRTIYLSALAVLQTCWIPTVAVARGTQDQPMRQTLECTVDGQESLSDDAIANTKKRAEDLQLQFEEVIDRLRADIAVSKDPKSRAQLTKHLHDAEKELETVRDIASLEPCPSQESDAKTYLQEVVRRIEECGSRNFPRQSGKKIYGFVNAEYIINEAGDLVSSKIIRSSHNIALDSHVLKLIAASAPFGPVPKSLQDGKYELFRFRNRFKFFHDRSNGQSLVPITLCKL